MNFYFASDTLCAIKINGVYFGLLNQAVKHLKIDTLNPPFIELCPVNSNEGCVTLLFDESFLTSPPKFLSVTDLKGGYLIKFSPLKVETEFKIIAQQKFTFAIATVFNENGQKISIETKNDFYAENLSFNCHSAKILESDLDEHKFILINLSSENGDFLYVYKITDKIQKVFCRQIKEFSTSPNFTTVETFNDIAKHTVKSTWRFKGNLFSRDSAEISCREGFNIDALNEKLIPYCFLESLLVGENIDAYLAQNVLENKKHLDGYLGSFLGVMPPPKFRSIDEVGLIYRKTDNCYFVDYFKFTLSNRKITNIIKCD